MNRLKQFLVFASIAFLIFACKKEYSVENGQGATATAQWQFTEGANKFKGPIDTAFVDTLNNILFLTLEGVSDNGQDNITLQIFTPSLKAGTYKTPLCSFDYQRSGATIYQSDLTAVDAFTITINHIDTAGVSGTFSGKALDKNGAAVTITDGQFSAKFKTSAPVVTPPVTDSGQVMLWSKAGCGGGTTPINVSVSNKSGQITTFTATEPTTCGAAGSFTAKLPVGTYTWKAKCGTDSISGSVSVTLNTCTKVLVDFSSPPPTGDYFPTTTNSNWTSMLEGGASGDSTFTLSTGNKKTFGTASYFVFNYDDYINGFTDTLYYRKGGGLYYEYYPADVNIFGFDNPTAVEYLFLDTSKAVGVTWKTDATGTIGGNAITGRIQGKILEKAASVTIGSLTFQDVIKVQLSYQYVVNNVPGELGRIEEWFARGKGLIKYQEYSTSPFTTADYILNTTRLQVY